MAALIETTDFVGTIELQSDQYTASDLQQYIDTYSRDSIYVLLGNTLGQLFLDDYDGGAGTPTGVYATIWNPLRYTHGGEDFRSQGMKFFVARYVWFFYARDNNVRVSIGGNKSKRSQNSDQNADPAWLAKVWNDAAETAQAIQYYCKYVESGDYPDFNGEYFENLIGL